MSDPMVPSRGRFLPGVMAVLANIVPLAGVAFLGWSAFTLIFLYWLENVAIGLRTFAAIAANMRAAGSPWPGVLSFCGFFAFHYGMFCFVHGVFVVVLFGDKPGVETPFGAMGPFLSEPGIFWGLISIGLWQVVQFVLFLARGEAKRGEPMALMMAPYPRIIALHVAIIGGGMLVMALNQPVAGLIVLALMKAGFDAAEALGRGFTSAQVTGTGLWRSRQ